MKVIEVMGTSLQLGTCCLPDPSVTEVLIKVMAAGVNRADIMQRKGLYPPPAGASDILGLEVAGIVEVVGADVDSVKIGDRVCALLTGGGYAEYCVADADLCLPIPKEISFIQAAGIPEAFFTVWSNLFDLAQIKGGDSLLVHGGSSGIGTIAIQMAKAFAIKVFITAGSQEKCDFCLQLGADAAINYQQQDFVSEIKQLTDNQGVDVILDMVGGDYFSRNIKCMAYDARLVQIAIQKGYQSEVNLLPIMFKRLTITGSTLRDRDVVFKRKIAKQLQQTVWPLLAEGELIPVIDTVFSLENVAQAHELMESSLHKGKIILTLD